METVQVPEQSSSISNYYLWEVPGKHIAIQLDFGVVDRLLVEVMRGFGAIPRRGAEVGGILLGSAEAGDRTIIRIGDFEPVACEHRRGPSYLLSDADRVLYEEALLRHRPGPGKQIYAVGCYRSHTREGISLSPEDLEHFEKYFPGPASTFLLVKPFATKVSVAGFFFREEGGYIHSEAPYQDFPFRRRELGGGASPGATRRDASSQSPLSRPEAVRQLPVNQAYPEPPQQAAAMDHDSMDSPPAMDYGAEPAFPEFDAENNNPATTQEVESSARRFRKRNVWIPLSFIFLLMGVLVGMQLAFMYRPLKSAGLLDNAYRLSLGVSRAGNDLHVRWDRTSPAVTMAQRGVLTIEDGSFRGTVDLDVIQLQNPNVYYRHITGLVRFRLEVFVKDHASVVETLEWRQ